MVQFVFRHLSIFRRPSSIEGKETWEEVHEPRILLDFKVGTSCLLFLIVAAVLWRYGAWFGAYTFVIVTLFSVLSDAVYYRHYYLDVTDRLTATLGVFYLTWFSTRWVIASDPTHIVSWFKLLLQVGSAMTPFKFLNQCRQFPVRSEHWRKNHVWWHVSGTLAMILSIYVSQGGIDEYLHQLHHLDMDTVKLYLTESSLVDLIDIEPIVSLLEI
ncbi:Hypothetical Protein FCC1311_072622 [Hondaea fermentalgiana]|uniref:Uncharacterized protein n=1 Tax=Hondaea fermentalgiana TaxID=2315210 RepID=A0A2R5GRS0_9STRA|nr:Hypothetical Protein FCC1311_072622 [Hondaea fermentalgiana]|eukprot:GBG31041.1 Hypothetical Protein FCC1311_072622 [Hondaea fermentalgiana]